MLTRRRFIPVLVSAIARPTGIRSGRDFGVALATDTITVRPRDNWGKDRTPLDRAIVEDVRFLLVHHSASPNNYAEEDVPSILQGFFDYHTSPDKGWSDIAYNFLIDQFGDVWEGRAGSLDGPVAGDATGGNQGFSQLICLIGDFSSELPTPEATSSLVSVLALLADSYGISTQPGSEVRFVSRGSNRWPAGEEVLTPPIAGHRDMSITSCPGDALYPYVSEDLIADVEAWRLLRGSTSRSSTTTNPKAEVANQSTAAAPALSQTVTIASGSQALPISDERTDSVETPLGGLWPLALAGGAVAALVAAIAKRQTENRESGSDEVQRK